MIGEEKGMLGDRSMGRAPERFASAAAAGGPADDADLLGRLLLKTSRTFALSIPVLPQPTCREVTVAYLLFRIADTLEDATQWSQARQVQELARLKELIRNPDVLEAEHLSQRWAEDPPLRHDGYLELLSHLPAVLRVYMEISESARAQLTRHLVRTIDGMASFLKEDRGARVELSGIDDLRRYCYAVAGIVGEMLTELFLLDRPPLEPIADQLREDAATFGEALQLVNILKDSASDAREGRRYLPSGVARADLLALARADLDRACQYCARLQEAGAPRGIVEFTALPVLLARGTLDRVEEHGAGAKLTRFEVAQIVEGLDEALGGGTFPEFWEQAHDRKSGSDPA